MRYFDASKNISVKITQERNFNIANHKTAINHKKKTGKNESKSILKPLK